MEVQKIEELAVRPEKAASLLDIGRTKLFQLIRDGEIRAIRHGKTTLVPTRELERWIAERLAAA